MTILASVITSLLFTNPALLQGVDRYGGAPLAESATENMKDIPEESILHGAVHTPSTTLAFFPKGSSRVVLLSIDLTAGCQQDLHLSGLEVGQIGLGSAQDIARVYAMQNGRRLTRSRQFSTKERTAMLRFRQFTIPACKTVTIDLAVDVKSTAASGGRFGLQIASPTWIETDAKDVTGNFPLQTNSILPDVTPGPVGNLEVAFSTRSRSIIATINEELAAFTLHATEASHLLSAITMTNEGTAKGSEVRDLYITRNNGAPLTNVAITLDRDQVRLFFVEPLLIEKGQTIRFQLRGKAWTRRKSISFTIEEPGDVEAETLQRLPRE